MFAAGLTVLAASAVRSQPAGRPARLGYLLLGPLADTPSPQRAAFFRRLRELGRVEGRNLAVEYRSADWAIERLAPLAKELANGGVDVIFANDTESATQVKRAGLSVP